MSLATDKNSYVTQNNQSAQTKLKFVNDIESITQVNPSIDFSFLCGHRYSKRDIFKTHLVTHFRDKLEELLPNLESNLHCDGCDFTGRDKNAMFAHFGLKHRLIRQFIPEPINEVLFKQMPQVRFEKLCYSNVRKCHLTMVD